MDDSLSIKFWDPLNSAYISVFITKRYNYDILELKICGEYEDRDGVPVHERCMTIYPGKDDVKELIELLQKVIP